jgi:hypothetical protein
MPPSGSIAFSSEVETGSREENASKQRPKPGSDSIRTERSLVKCTTSYKHQLSLPRIAVRRTASLSLACSRQSIERTRRLSDGCPIESGHDDRGVLRNLKPRPRYRTSRRSSLPPHSCRPRPRTGTPGNNVRSHARRRPASPRIVRPRRWRRRAAPAPGGA